MPSALGLTVPQSLRSTAERLRTGSKSGLEQYAPFRAMSVYDVIRRGR